jgi:hypothetical protein
MIIPLGLSLSLSLFLFLSVALPLILHVLSGPCRDEHLLDLR